MNTNLVSRASWNRLGQIVERRDGAVCQYCGENASDGEPDHILPLEKGGRDSFDNLVWSCQRCNREKQGMTLREWIISIRSRYSDPIPRSKGHRGKTDLAVQWLTDLFSETDSVLVPVLVRAGLRKGFSDSLLNKAKDKINQKGDFAIVSKRTGKHWSWTKKDPDED
jgi:hypothetical protein